MKGAIKAKCKLDYDGIYAGEEITAIYSYSARHRKNVYHIASQPISDKIFDKHFQIIN